MVQFSAGRVVKMLLGVLLFTSSFHCSANLEQTLAYIDRLLENNKKVAILMVDMQEQFSQYFSGPPQIKDQIIGDQMTLVDKMAGSDGVFFVDINLIPQKYGNTVPVLLSRMKKNKNYSLVLKDYDSAFYSSTQVMTVDESGSQKEMQIIDGNLQHFLDKNGIQDVVITGCFDGSCVFATAMDALDAGYIDVSTPYAYIFRDKHRLCAQREKIQAPFSFAAAVISTLSLPPEETAFLFLEPCDLYVLLSEHSKRVQQDLVLANMAAVVVCREASLLS